MLITPIPRFVFRTASPHWRGNRVWLFVALLLASVTGPTTFAQVSCPAPTVTGNLSICQGSSTTLTVTGSGVQLRLAGGLSGFYTTGLATFGPPVSTSLMSGTIAYIRDGSNSYQGCSSYPANSLAGKIALIDRGASCLFINAVKNAQNAGAIGVIIANNRSGAAPGLGGTDATITIPTISLPQTDGDALKTALGSGTVTGEALAFSYTWAPATGLATTTGLSTTANPTATTTYTVTGTASGCSSSTEVIVTVNSIPSVTLTAPPSLTVRTGESLTLTASGATSYVWSANAVGVQSGTALTSTGGIYSVTGTTNGCSASASVQVSVTALSFCGTVVYATPTGAGLKDGSSWTNALAGIDLPPALASSCSGTTFLVGGGLYKPTSFTTDRTGSFSVASGVEVYGGYTVSGSTATRGAINPVAGTPSSTTFSGDIDNDNLTDNGNSYHVVSLSNASPSTRLDGLVITGGYANGSNSTVNIGAGLYNVVGGSGQESSPTLTNCLFTANWAFNGAGLSNSNGSTPGTSRLTLTNAVFTSNTATNYGGGLYIEGSTTTHVLSLSNTSFTNNMADNQGGALFSRYAVVSVQSSTLSQNRVNNQGGAIQAQDGSLTIVNSTISSNTATGFGGGGIFLNNTSLQADNLDLTANVVSNQGGGLLSVSNSTVQITNSRIRQNRSSNQGGGLYVDSRVTLTGCDLSQNTVSNSGGGAIGATNPLNLSLTNCTLNDNVGQTGGAILFEASNCTLVATGSSFTGNIGTSTSDSRGGGAYCTGAGGTLARFSSCTFTDNRHIVGGAIGNGSNSTVVVAGGLFARNQASYGNNINRGGGAIFSNGHLVITDCQFSQNTATGSGTPNGGGAVFVNSGGSSSFTNCSFSQNVGNQGGAIFNLFAPLSLTSVAFSQNRSSAEGGALYINGTSGLGSRFQSVSLTQNTSGSNGGGAWTSSGTQIGLTGVLMSQNTATGSGGGLYADQGSNLTLVNGVASGNRAGQSGGAFFTTSGSQLLWLNALLARNTAGVSGGAGLAQQGGPNYLQLVNATIVGNSAPTAAVLQTDQSLGAKLTNSIVWQNGTPATNFSVANGGSLTLVNSLVDPASSPFTDGGSNLTVDPLFMNAATDDFRLTGCSPALNVGQNAANSQTTDLASLARVVTTTIDLGAYEYQSAPFGTLTATIGGNLTVCAGSPTTLTAGLAGGIAPTSYTWSTGASTSAITLSPASASTISVTVNAEGCLASTTVAITVNPALTVTVSAIPPSLTVVQGTSATLTATGAPSFTWSTGATSASVVVSATAVGSNVFSVTGTDGNCPAVVSTTVTATPPPGLTLVTAATPGTICVGSSVTASVTATGGIAPYGYSWAAPAGVTISGAANQSTVTATGSASGVQTFTLTVSSASNGPVSTTTVDVTVNAIPVVRIAATPSLTVCSGGSVTLTASGGSGQPAASFTWSNGLVSSSLVVSNVTATTALSITGATGGCSATASAQITVSPAVTAVITPNPGLTVCASAGGLLTASGAGVGGSYVWSTGAMGAVLTVNATATYSVTAISSAGCSGTASADVVAQNSSPIATPVLSPSSGVGCEGGSISVTATGGMTTYQWHKDGVSLGAAQSSSVLTLNGLQAAQAGSYVLVATASGCGSATSSAFVLTVNPLPTVTIAFPTSASITPNAVITVPVGQGLSYQVFGGGSNARYERKIVEDRINGYLIQTVVENRDGVFSIDRAGPYTITVTDANGCNRTVGGEIRGR